MEELKTIEMLEDRYNQTLDEIDAEFAAAEKELEAMQAELVQAPLKKLTD